jgi:diguanylate cyclase
MFTIYNCIAYEHDLRLVVLAAIVCALASFAAINFLNHVRKTTGYMRDVWLCVAATASGFGIWATHFIAMLAYSPGIPSGYNIILTILSLLAAIMLTGVGLSIASGNRGPAGRWIGGRRSAAASRRCTTPEWQPSRSLDGFSGTPRSSSLP